MLHDARESTLERLLSQTHFLSEVEEEVAAIHSMEQGEEQ